MTELSIGIVEYGSAAYQDTLRLREEILRKPLGRKLSPEELANDARCHHIAAVREGGIAACLIVEPQPENATLRLRQVAVAADAQGTGLGKKLMAWSEDFCRTRQARRIVLNARDTALGFYEKLGYRKISGSNITGGLLHWEMEKEI